MMVCRCRYALPAVSAFLLCLALSGTVFAKDNPTYTQMGRSINVGPNDQVGDVTCLGCSIHVRGIVAGDVTTVGGSITIEDQAQVSGDVTAVGGNMRLGNGVKVNGDATVVGGELRRDPGASVGGDVTSMSGRGWLVLIILVPLVVLGLLVAFAIWVVQRLRTPSEPVPVA